MAIIETVLERKTQDGKTFWIAVIDGKEVMAWDAKVLEFKGKECPYPIIKTKSGKDMIQFPKEGGYQGKSGGGWKGKSDLEIKAQILTMCMAYSKDVVVAYFEKLPETDSVFDLVLQGYRKMSESVLADLAKIAPTPEAPKQEAPKVPEKLPVPVHKSSDNEDLPKTTIGEMTVKQKLEHEMHNYLKSMGSDTKESFRILLMDISGFPGKDRETGELTGKMVCVEDIEDKKFSDKWALSSYGKLKKLREEQEVQEHYSAGKEDDINF